jgi:hypothetical protein
LLQLGFNPSPSFTTRIIMNNYEEVARVDAKLREFAPEEVLRTPT